MDFEYKLTSWTAIKLLKACSKTCKILVKKMKFMLYRIRFAPIASECFQLKIKLKITTAKKWRKRYFSISSVLMYIYNIIATCSFQN